MRQRIIPFWSENIGAFFETFIGFLDICEITKFKVFSVQISWLLLISVILLKVDTECLLDTLTLMNVSEQDLTFIRKSFNWQAFILIELGQIWFYFDRFRKFHNFDIGYYEWWVLELDEHLVVGENGAIFPVMLLLDNICGMVDEHVDFWGPHLSFITIPRQDDPCEVVESVGWTTIMDRNDEFILVLVRV